MWRAPLGLILAAPLAAQTSWVVDDDGGPGVHFTAIQPAIDAASPGDSISVRDGTYGAIRLGKPLALVGSGAAACTVDGTSVIVGIRGGLVEIEGLGFVGSLTVTGVTAPLALRDVVCTGISSNGYFSIPALSIVQSGPIHARACTAVRWPALGATGLATVEIDRSEVYLDDCTVDGTRTLLSTLPNPAALRSVDSQLVVAGGSFHGTDAPSVQAACVRNSWPPGGDGLVVAGGRVTLMLGCTVRPGAGAYSIWSGACSGPGNIVVGTAHVTPDTPVPGASLPAMPRLDLPSGVALGTSFTASITHLPGITTALFVDLEPGYLRVPGFDLPLLLGPGLAWVAATHAAGAFVALPLGMPIDPVLRGRPLFFQAVAVSAAAPDFRLSNAVAMRVL